MISGMTDRSTPPTPPFVFDEMGGNGDDMNVIFLLLPLALILVLVFVGFYLWGGEEGPVRRSGVSVAEDFT